MTTDPSSSKVLDLVEFIEEQAYVTAPQVAKAFGVTCVEAEDLLRHLPFDPGEGIGVFSIPEKCTLDGFLENVVQVDPNQTIEDLLIEIRGDESPFESKVLEGMAELREIVLDVQARMSAYQTPRRPRRRRRKRGELLRVRPEDSKELAEMRQKAAEAIAKARQDGNKDAVYQTWYQRIESQEEKEGVGKFSEPLPEPPSPARVEGRLNTPPPTT